MTDFSHLTTGTDELWREFIDRYSGSVTINTLTMSAGQILGAVSADVTGASADVYLHKSHAEILADIQTEESGSAASHLTMSVNELLAGIVSGSEAPSLAALTLNTSTVVEGTAAGVLVGTLQGVTGGSTLSITDTAGNRFALDTGTIETGAVATDYETATTHNITVREELVGASNTPRDTVLAITVTDVFSPLDLTPTAWYDPSDLTTLFQDSAMTTPVTTHGDPVGAIRDKSGNNYHLVQATTANKPAYQAGSGLHWLLFDGVADRLLGSGNITGPAAWSACAGGMRHTIAAGTDSLIDCDLGVGARYAQLLRVTGATLESVTFNTAFAAFIDSGGTIAANVAFVGSSVRGATTIEAWKNGVSGGSTATTGTPQTTTTTPLALGALATVSAQQLLDGRIYGALMLGRTFTSTERQSMESYMAAKSGVTL